MNDQIQGVPPKDSTQPSPTGAPSPAPEDDGPEHVEPSPEVQVPEGNKDSGRHSAYDKTYLKYVGGVHDTKAKAEKAAKAAGVTDYDVVEV